MNTQLINQIKALQGVKEVTMVNDMAVVVFEPINPVFTTEDGVDIFEGDTYWWVNTTKGQYINLFEVNTPGKNISDGLMFNFPHVKLFSTPESAKKWIDENKKPNPIYTDPDDGTEFFEGDACWWFIKRSCEIRDHILSTNIVYGSDDLTSKIYKSRQLCELALAKFITDKYK